MMPEALIAGAAACVILGLLIGLAWGAADTTHLKRLLTDQRRATKHWTLTAFQQQREANKWRNRARLAEEIHGLERRLLGVDPGPDDHIGSRKAPELQLVTDDPKGFYAAKAWERKQERAAQGEER